MLGMLLIFAVGILIGGVVNVLADDLPQGRWPRLPRYADGKPRPIYAWLGVSALLFSHWRPLSPSPRLSWRYPLTELALAAALLVMQVVTAADASIADEQRLIWRAHAAIFVLLALVDLERKRVLLAPTLAAAALALVDAALFPQPAPNLASALVGGVGGGATFTLAYLGGKLFAKQQGGIASPVFGKGDVYLMGLGGLILGFPNVLAAMLLAILFGGSGAALYLIRLRLQGRQYKRYTALPYAPYILSATYIVLILQDGVGALLNNWIM